MAEADCQFEPFFLVGTRGNIYISAYYPVNFSLSSRKAIIHTPAFAEEMNKSRRMVAMQAREFAKEGHAVFILDLFGTGDSAGDFSEATWEQWKTDINSLCVWLLDREYEILGLWGLRTGVLLAMDFISETSHKINHLICWQPVFFGETFILQFLRLRTAAAMMNQNAPQEKVSDLKKQLEDGQSVEIAGYTLNPNLACPMLKLTVEEINLQHIENISIFEIVNVLEKKIPLSTAKIHETLKMQVKKFSVIKVLGSPFWSTQEITEVPYLLKETAHCLTPEA